MKGFRAEILCIMIGDSSFCLSSLLLLGRLVGSPSLPESKWSVVSYFVRTESQEQECRTPGKYESLEAAHKNRRRRRAKEGTQQRPSRPGRDLPLTTQQQRSSTTRFGFYPPPPLIPPSFLQLCFVLLLVVLLLDRPMNNNNVSRESLNFGTYQRIVK